MGTVLRGGCWIHRNGGGQSLHAATVGTKWVMIPPLRTPRVFCLWTYEIFSRFSAYTPVLSRLQALRLLRRDRRGHRRLRHPGGLVVVPPSQGREHPMDHNVADSGDRRARAPTHGSHLPQMETDPSEH